MYVLDGECEATRGDVADSIGTGDSLSVPAGVGHAFRNPSSGPLLLFAVMAPLIDRPLGPPVAIPRPTREGEATVTLMGERSFQRDKERLSLELTREQGHLTVRFTLAPRKP